MMPCRARQGDFPDDRRSGCEMTSHDMPALHAIVQLVGLASCLFSTYYSYFSAEGGDVRFNLVDRILAWESGKSIRAIKHLTLAEEYLADHFPRFPVMPGVLQLQALVEAGAWLMRLSDDFKQTVWVLREAKNVKYGTLVAPGQRMEMSIELSKREGDLATFKGRAEVNGSQAVSAQFTLLGYNLRDRHASGAQRDERLREFFKSRASLLLGELSAPAM